MTKVDLSEFYRYCTSKNSPCKLGLAMKQLNDDELPVITAAIETKEFINAQAIVTWLEKRNIKGATAASVTNHRKQICNCYRD